MNTEDNVASGDQCKGDVVTQIVNPRDQISGTRVVVSARLSRH